MLLTISFEFLLLLIPDYAVAMMSSGDLKTFCENSTTREWSQSSQTCLEYFSTPLSTFDEAEKLCTSGTVGGRLAHIRENSALTAARSLGTTGWVGAKRTNYDCSEYAAEDCAMIKTQNLSAVTGIYTIKLTDGNCDEILGGYTSLSGICCVEAYCEMDRFGGGWTVFQKRFDGTVDFYRNWLDYEAGFGSPYTEFYAGNKFLNYFTARRTYELLVELEQKDEMCKLYAHYSSLLVSGDKYMLSLGSYLGGTTGDSLTYHNTMNFSTYDQDNDKHETANCAYARRSGWWHKSCHHSNLNGLYHDGCSGALQNMFWKSARALFYSFKGTEMKLRPVNYSLHDPQRDAQLCPADYVPIPCARDCHWNSWDSWGSCNAVQHSEIYGEMIRTRSRNYTGNGGTTSWRIMACRGNEFDIKFCNIYDTTSLPDCDDLTPEDCSEIKLANASTPSGIYTIKLKYGSCDGVSGTEVGGRCCLTVYCDMDRFGGGWTVFQKRYDGSVDFERNWTEYEVGFGSLSDEFYAGNQFLHQFTKRQNYDLLIELNQNTERCKVYAHYSQFSVGSNSEKYKLSAGSYIRGTAGDSLQFMNNAAFTTYDEDNDVSDIHNCATEYKGGWWYTDCHTGNLNGEYFDGCHSEVASKISWWRSRAFYYSFAGTEMKLRPTNFKGDPCLDWHWIENHTSISNTMETVVQQNFLESSSFHRGCMHFNSSVFESKSCAERLGRLCEYYSEAEVCQPNTESQITFVLHSRDNKPMNNASFEMEFSVDLQCTRQCWLTCCNAVAYNKISGICYVYTNKVNELILTPDPGTNVFIKQ